MVRGRSVGIFFASIENENELREYLFVCEKWTVIVAVECSFVLDD